VEQRRYASVHFVSRDMSPQRRNTAILSTMEQQKYMVWNIKLSLDFE